MILGIGTDIVDMERIQRIYGRHGERFLKRCYAEQEIKIFQAFNKEERAHAYLAKRFAAKEACVKALGSGVRGGISLKEIVIVNNDLGKPGLELRGRAADLAESFGKKLALHLSLSDEPPYAIAFVTAELREGV